MIPLGIFANDKWFGQDGILTPVRDGYDVQDLGDWRRYDRAALQEKLRSVEVLLLSRGAPHLPAELASDLGRLRYVCYCHGSIKSIIPKRLIEAGLVVSNWGDSVEGVAEGTLALMLCMLKQIVTLNQFTKTGTDQRIHQAYPCTLRGCDVGLYGFGPIGRHTARMLQPFEAKIAIYDPFAKHVPHAIRRCATLRELFATCSIVSIHCGLNDTTRNSVTRELLSLLPQGGILINTARGDIVDEAALGELVRDGRLLTGMDVIRDEAKWDWAGSPAASSPHSVLTRHNIGGGKGYPPGQEPKPRLPEHVIHNLAAYRQGQPLAHLVTADIYDLKT